MVSFPRTKDMLSSCLTNAQITEKATLFVHPLNLVHLALLSSNGGFQRLITPDGCHVPLSHRAGFPCMDMRPPVNFQNQ
jgi:hypothetical protein